MLPTSQHIPASFEDAQLQSRTNLERSGKAGGACGKPINITITPSEDTIVWNKMQEVLSRASTPRNTDDSEEFDLHLFNGMFFAYDSKGLKAATQRRRALSKCISHFQAGQDRCYREVRSVGNRNKRYIDIAAEVLAVSDASFPSGSTFLAEPDPPANSEPAPEPSDAAQRIARRKKQAELLQQAKGLKPDGKTKALKKRFWFAATVNEVDGLYHPPLWHMHIRLLIRHSIRWLPNSPRYPSPATPHDQGDHPPLHNQARPGPCSRHGVGHLDQPPGRYQAAPGTSDILGLPRH